MRVKSGGGGRVVNETRGTGGRPGAERGGKAGLGKRFLASLVDGVAAAILGFIPLVGFILGGAYILTKDALVYELTKNQEFKNKSLGKRLLGLEVARLQEGGYVDWTTSIKRNITLAVGYFLVLIPAGGLWATGFFGQSLGSFIAVVIALVEIILVFTDPEGKRLGDRFALTKVIETAQPEKAAK